MKLDDLNFFRHVVEQGSYTAASRKTGVPVATLTRRIQALEECLNIRLLNRHARKLSLTEAGERFYQECSPLLKQLIHASHQLTDDCRGAAGRLRIAAPSNLTKVLLQPMLNAFMATYPDIQLALGVSNQTEQLDPTDWDVIFRVGPQRDSTLIARKISQVEDILVSTTCYLAQYPAPAHAQDLSEHMLLKGHPLMRWRLSHQPSNELITINEQGRFEASELGVVREACLAGLGIALLPNIMVQSCLEDNALVRVLPQWSANTRDVFLLYNHREHQPEKLRLFIDFASQYFSLGQSDTHA
ncbi:HTH-type transcriptional regulator DmlR [Vibrio stylophorae]|uniref:HTH-type transcriptional regulator DmlR n=1 Tax=Vibrio stylophorae TaxID=659351 RepID=A0ABM8ZUR3_9VIBR|nr:LysR family transcriptional regulator [Vibrio stylophorae]CAH0534057.1 HTH-type transcriptional regulator DmlR [Vibrio stylophorae]